MDLSVMLRGQGLSPAVQFFLTSAAAMLILALLDFVGAVFAKEWADTRQPLWFALGTLCFMGLFAFYAASSGRGQLWIDSGSQAVNAANRPAATSLLATDNV